jgi:putative DNA primase/helicase
MTIDIERIREALSFVPSSDRTTWVRMGMAVKSELDDSGFDLWNIWSQQDNSYNLRDAQDVWKSIRPDGEVTIGTLYYEAKLNGWYDNRQYHAPDPIELAERQRNIAKRVEDEEKKINQERAKAASMAQEIWSNATEVNIDNPYLVRKRVSPVQTMREIHVNTVAMILGYSPQSKGEPLIGRLLVIPIKVNGKLSTVELIDESGRKAVLVGRGTKVGGYWAAQQLPDEYDESLTVLIAEGAITALAAKEASGHYTVASLSSGNLLAVATTIRKRYPTAILVILADLVKTNGNVVPDAIKAAQAVDGLLAVPNFGSTRSADDKDFNDMFTLLGIEAVKQAIANASKPINDNHHSVKIKGWLTPQPLLAKIDPEPYPLDALPGMIRAAVEEVHGFTKAPIPLVVSSALATLSLAAQTHADAKRAEKLSGPVSLFLLTIADSGERKSTCDGFFNKAIRDYDKAQAELAKPAIKDYKAAVEAWEAKRCGIKDKIRQLAKGENSTICMENALRELEHEKPEPPRVPRLIYSDATPEALAYSLSKNWPSGGVVSAEAGIVFGSHSMSKDSVMRNLALLNVLWDGGEITIDRRTTESFIVRGVRLTVGLQVQEATLHNFFDRSGALARGTGFLARFLVSWPESTQGYRAFTDAPANWPALESFNRRIAAILDHPTAVGEEGMLKPILLSLSAEAKASWITFHDAIEGELVSGGELYDVRDVASKIADNAARLAALFHLFEIQRYSDISVDVLVSASRIVAWHLNEARRFFGELALPVEMGNAIRLDSWLINYCQRQKTNIVPRREIQRNVTPVHLRQQSILDSALRELIESDRILLKQNGRRKEIHVNPALINKEEK